MDDRVGVAIVGAGFMGSVHAALLKADPRTDMRWVVDLDTELADELAQTAGARRTADLAEALGDDAVGLVVVATPPPTHQPIAERALTAGRHALVEKPLVLDADHAERLGSIARDHDVVLAYGGNFVYAPKFVRAKELAGDAVAMGTVHSVRVAFRIAGPETDAGLTRAIAGGGALTDIGWHAIELCRWLLGKPAIEAVTACASGVGGEDDVERRGVILLHFAGGALGQCDVAWLWPGGEQLTLEVTGTDGTVAADFWQGMGIDGYTNNEFAEVWAPNRGWTAPEWEWIRNSGYEHQDRRVVDAVAGGPPLEHSADDAVAILRALQAAYASAAAGRTVRLDG